MKRFLIVLAVIFLLAPNISSAQFPEGVTSEQIKKTESEISEKALTPATNLTTEKCHTIINEWGDPQLFKDLANAGLDVDIGDVLGCAIKTGRIKLWMVPYFIRYFIQFLLGIAGLVSVLFMMVGGYKYVFGGLSEDKESGKNTLKYAIIGLLVSLLAFALVSAVQFAVTG